jgi:FtsP/CotA-like multicopper oxidase with cupredoxin domain
LIALVLVACGGSPRDSDRTEHHDVDPWLDPQPPLLEDENPDPSIFEATITAAATTWPMSPDLDVEGLAYNGTVPGPLIRVALGTEVIVHFDNDMPMGFDTAVHWHGIEGNNASDGTPVTQNAVMMGESFTYDFVVTRPGLFWYHPHVRGAQGVFDGLYGALVVEDPDEQALRDLVVLPEDERVLVLSDLSVFGGVPWSVEVDNPMEVMNGTEGEHLLVNGREDPVFEVRAGEPLRLRVVNTSITRFWRLSVPGTTLYRIGGEGGLLDRVRVEGGSIEARVTSLSDGSDLGTTQFDLGYPRGEIVLAPAERADLVLVPEGEPGEELELRWEDVARGRHGMWMEGDEMVMGDVEDDGTRPGETAATFRLVEGNGDGWPLDEGDPVLGAVGRSVGTVPSAGALDWSGDLAMTFDEQMDMWQDKAGTWQMSTQLRVDGAEWMEDMMGGPSQPEAPTAVHARVGDVIAWELRNESHMAHPLHIHGFSFQPISFAHRDDEAGTLTTWDVGYDEYEDTILLPGETSVFVRLPLADPVGGGAAAGRWMRHCHILQHGENGMMSELVVDE